MTPPRVVLVSGATKGIGEATALALDRLGFRVFAGYRSDRDAERLRAAGSELLQPVRLDVTRPRDVAATASVVEAAVGNDGLWGLVNNAGIVVPAPLELLDIDDLRQQFDVNVHGVLRLTQALLPALRRARGRIVNVSSVNGRIVTPWAGAYAASKFALEALSDGLRAELSRWKIEVIVVQPGAIQTPIWDTSRERGLRLAESFPEGRRDLYRSILDRLGELHVPDRALPATRVADVIARALMVRRPRTRYRVGWDARLGVLIAHLFPGRLITRLVTGRRRRSLEGSRME